MITFERDGSQNLEKDIMDYKTGQRLGEDLRSRVAQKSFKIGTFLK